MNSTVKPMELKDLERVCTLTNELGYEVKVSEIETRFNEIERQTHHALFVIGDDTVDGLIHLEVVLDLIEEKKVEIKALVVNEKKRSLGLGKVLLEKAKEWARSNGVSIIYLSCNIIRDRAHTFYLREGFKKQKTSHFFELEL